MIEYIPTVLASINITKETVKLMIDAPKQLEKTEIQLKLASVNRTLFDAENALLESQKLIKEKDSRIAELEDLLKFKAKLIRKDGKYFETDENGSAIGEPYCPRCWESEQKPIYLLPIEDEEDHFRCANCKNFFGKRKQLSSSSGYY